MGKASPILKFQLAIPSATIPMSSTIRSVTNVFVHPNMPTDGF